MRYYIIYNGQQYGPLEKEQLRNYNLNYDSDVWAEGMPAWAKASDVMELKQFIDSLNASATADQRYYFMMINGQQCGPFTKEELKSKGLRPDSHVWKNGMNDWMLAAHIPELQPLFQSPTPPPFTNSATAPVQPTPQYAPGQNIYDNPQNVNHTDWLPWAIAGTILGFLCSCIGCIFGIIGILKANSANKLYNEGNIQQAESENSSAKTMTIIALALSALGSLGSIFYLALL